MSYRGEPVAEIRQPRQGPEALEDRLNELKRRGIIVASGQHKRQLSALADRPGALQRFLDERNE